MTGHVYINKSVSLVYYCLYKEEDQEKKSELWKLLGDFGEKFQM